LKLGLQSWLKADSVTEVFVLAQASTTAVYAEYGKVMADFANEKRLKWTLYPKGIGSINARNILLDQASKSNCTYTLMADDDYILPEKACLVKMANLFEFDNKIGAIGGRVVVKGLRQDGDFFLNLPFNAVDIMSKLTGYVFLDVKHGPRYSEFLTPFFMMKKDLLEKRLRYDKTFVAPTGFREESDFQNQIKAAGYKLLFDPRRYVIHLGVEKGGCRPEMKMGKRMYWKARNSTLFILKWTNFIPTQLWYILVCTLLLSLYRPWTFSWVFLGINDGIHGTKKHSTE
jgi:GT2 family glycosyltransferase